MWANAKDCAKDGDIESIPPELYIKYYRTFKDIAKDHMIRPADLPAGTTVGYWHWGKTGRGKTFAALRDYPEAYRKISNNKWWDGYMHQEAVIIDDLDKAHHYMGYHLKIWADRYAFVVETKGSSLYVRPGTVIVTSNYHPKDIWEDATTLEPIMRRFKVVQHCFTHETPLDYGYENDSVEYRIDETRVVPEPSGLAPNFSLFSTNFEL